MADASYLIDILANTDQARSEVQALEAMIDGIGKKTVDVKINWNGDKDIKSTMSRTAKIMRKEAGKIDKVPAISPKFDSSKYDNDIQKYRDRQVRAADTAARRLAETQKYSTKETLKQLKEQYNITGKLNHEEENRVKKTAAARNVDEAALKTKAEQQKALQTGYIKLAKEYANNRLDLSSPNITQGQVEEQYKKARQLDGMLRKISGLSKETGLNIPNKILSSMGQNQRVYQKDMSRLGEKAGEFYAAGLERKIEKKEQERVKAEQRARKKAQDSADEPTMKDSDIVSGSADDIAEINKVTAAVNQLKSAIASKNKAMSQGSTGIQDTCRVEAQAIQQLTDKVQALKKELGGVSKSLKSTATSGAKLGTDSSDLSDIKETTGSTRNKAKQPTMKTQIRTALSRNKEATEANAILEAKRQTIGLTEEEAATQARIQQTMVDTRKEVDAINMSEAQRVKTTDRLRKNQAEMDKNIAKNVNKHNDDFIRNAGITARDDMTTRFQKQLAMNEAEWRNSNGKYVEGYKHYIDEQSRALSNLNSSLAASKNATGTELDDLRVQARTAAQTFQESQKILDNSKRFLKDSGKNEYVKSAPVGMDRNSDEYAESLYNAAHAMNKGSLESTEYNKKTQKMEATVRTATGVMEKYALSYDSVSGKIDSSFMGNVQQIKPLGDYFSKLGGKFGELTRYALANVGVFEIAGAIKNGVGHVKELDDAMTELRKTSSGTSQDYAKFTEQANKDAKAIGSTTTTITDSAADWSRLGYTLQDSSTMAKNTGILKNVSEFESISDATDSMIGIMQAYDIKAGDSMGIIDQLNKIGNSYSISTSDLASGLQIAGSALQVGGNSIEQSMALITGFNSSIQDVNQAARAARTVSMRLHGATVSDLEEAGEDTTGLIETVPKLEKTVKDLTAVHGKAGISITDSTGRIKDDYENILEIAQRWEEIGQADIEDGMNRQSALLEALANFQPRCTEMCINVQI